MALKFSILAIKKNSAWVIEKCIEKASQDVLKMFVDKLAEESDAIKAIIESNYGLYVIQKLLELFSDNTYENAKKIKNAIN